MPNRDGEAPEGGVATPSATAAGAAAERPAGSSGARPPEEAPTQIRSVAEIVQMMADLPTEAADRSPAAQAAPASKPAEGSARSELQAGDFVAGIRLSEPLATGQRVTCWRGQQADRTAATVHLLYAGATERESQTFTRGASRMGAIAREHPQRGVARVLRVVPGKKAYVTDMAAAGTMDDLPLLHWGLPEKVSFLRGTCAALGAVHASGHTHGCLRPASVLLDEELQPILCDIGAVNLADSFPGKAASDNDYAPYAAPEVRKGAPTSVRSDIYGVGRLLYFLLLDQHPSEPDEDVPVLATLSAKAPEGLVRIVRRATALDPTMRYPNIETLLDDIAKYQSAGLVGLPAPELPAQAPAGAAPAPKPSASHDAGDVVRAPVADRSRVEAQRRLAAAQARAPQSRVVPARAPDEPRAKPAVAAAAPEQDIATWRQRLALTAFGLAALGAGLANTFLSGVETIVGASAVLVGAVALSAFVPAAPALPRASRLGWAVLLVASVAWFDPGLHAARAGRIWQLGPSRASTRLGALSSLRAKGLVEFVDLDLSGADLSGLDLSHLVFDRSRLVDVKLVGARLAGVSVVETDLAGADLSGADLEGVDVTRSVGWVNTLCSTETRMPKGWACVDGTPTTRGGFGTRSQPAAP